MGNEAALPDQWPVTTEAIRELHTRSWHGAVTCAKTGDGVEAAPASMMVAE